MNKQIEVMLSYRCNQSCRFCSSWSLMQSYGRRRYPRRRLAERLVALRNEGYSIVNFTGGEPVLDAGLITLLRLCRKLGFETYLSTNGHGITPELARLLDRVCISIHGATAATHDGLTQKRGSFRRTLKALEAIPRHGPRTSWMTNTVITSGNLGELESIVDLAGKVRGVRLILLSNMAPEGNALTHFSRLVVPLADLGRACRDLMRRRPNDGPIVRFFGIPLCVLGEYKTLSNDLAYDPRLTIELAGRNGATELKESFFRRPDFLRSHSPKCAPCRFRSLCGGVFTPYLERYGDAELTPS